MAFNFKDIDVTIGGSGILAESAQISSKNTLLGVYSVGSKGVISNSPNGPIKNTFSFSYFCEINNEPNYGLVNTIKSLINDVFIHSGTTIAVAGITGYNCYLDSYSIRISPNSPIKANASFSSYIPTSGTVRIKESISPVQYNTNNSIGYGWLTFVTDTGNFTSFPSYSFDYSWSASWEPIYSVGQINPVQVNINGGSENFNLLTEKFINIGFTGEPPYNNLININNNNFNIACASIGLVSNAGYNTMTFNISGSQISSSNLSASVDNIVLSQTTFNKFF